MVSSDRSGAVKPNREFKLSKSMSRGWKPPPSSKPPVLRGMNGPVGFPRISWSPDSILSTRSGDDCVGCAAMSARVDSSGPRTFGGIIVGTGSELGKGNDSSGRRLDNSSRPGIRFCAAPVLCDCPVNDGTNGAQGRFVAMESKLLSTIGATRSWIESVGVGRGSVMESADNRGPRTICGSVTVKLGMSTEDGRPFKGMRLDSKLSSSPWGVAEAVVIAGAPLRMGDKSTRGFGRFVGAGIPDEGLRDSRADTRSLKTFGRAAIGDAWAVTLGGEFFVAVIPARPSSKSLTTINAPVV